MLSCTFFGHRDCPENIKPLLLAVLENLIVVCKVDVFYVGHQGRFDACVRSVLRQLADKYPHICYAVVLSYFSEKMNENLDYTDTMIPEGIENIHPKYAITWRNNWMLKKSDYVVTYIDHHWGGAAQFAKKAEKQGKTVVNLSDFRP